MTAPALMQAAQYFEAWNAHDPEAVTAALADGATYADPTTSSPLAGHALAEHIGALFAAFPDLNLEVVSSQPADVGTDGTMVVQWRRPGDHAQPPAPGRRQSVLRRAVPDGRHDRSLDSASPQPTQGALRLLWRPLRGEPGGRGSLLQLRQVAASGALVSAAAGRGGAR
jgi:hypothetical protein